MLEVTIETEAMGRFDNAVDEVVNAKRGLSGFVLAYGGRPARGCGKRQKFPAQVG